MNQANAKNIQFKEEDVRPESMTKTMVAFSNTDGGTILIGVDDNGKIKGISKTDLEEWVVNISRTNCIPSVEPQIEKVSIENKQLLYVEIPRGIEPRRSRDGRYYIRVGSTNREPSTFELARLFQRTTLLNFDEKTIPQASLNDIDLKKVNEYLQLRRQRMLDESKIPIPQLLSNIGILSNQKGDYYATVAGILVFGKQPQRYFKNAVIRAAYYHEDKISNHVIDQKQFDSTLPEQIEDAVAFVNKLMLLPSSLQGIKRQERPEYPIEAIREAIINAVAHRDYSITGSAIHLFMFRDRLEIYSPGGLPNTLTIESIKLKQFARNQTIMSYLAGYRYTEQRGEGIIKMIDAMLGASLPEPVFQEIENEFYVIFYNKTASD